MQVVLWLPCFCSHIGKTHIGRVQFFVCKAINRKLRYFLPRFQLVLSTIHPSLFIFFNFKNTAMSRSISNGLICMSFRKRLRLRSCELCLTRQATLYELRPTQSSFAHAMPLLPKRQTTVLSDSNWRFVMQSFPSSLSFSIWLLTDSVICARLPIGQVFWFSSKLANSFPAVYQAWNLPLFFCQVVCWPACFVFWAGNKIPGFRRDLI